MTEQYTMLYEGKERKHSPKSSTLSAILAYSKSVEVKKKAARKVLIHLN